MNATRSPSVSAATDGRVADRKLPTAPEPAAGADAPSRDAMRRPWVGLVLAVTALPAAIGGLGDPAKADDATVAPSSTAPASPAPFQPQELSVGEPISLPNAAPLQPSKGTMFPSLPPPTAAVAAAPGGGTGWLGIAVDDAVLTGRLVVVEVAPDSPAARAGVRQQDVLLAINGSQLHTADEMAAALAAISPGQRVKAAVGRENKVDDLVMTATTRPAEAMSRNWQPADEAAASSQALQSAPAAISAPQPSAVLQPPVASVPADLHPPAVATPIPGRPNPPVASTAPAAAFSAAVPSAQASPAFVPAAAAAPVFQASPSPLPAMPSTAAVLPTPVASGQAAVPPLTGQSQAGGRIALGVRTVPVDPGVQSRFQLADSRGAFVIGVVDDLPAAKAGVPPGSVIVALNQQPVRSPQELTQLVTHGPVGTPVTLHYVLPGGQSRQASVILQSLDEPLERALVGADGVSRTTVPPDLHPAPQTARRVQPSSAFQPADQSPLARLEETLRRMATRLEQIDRRLDRLEAGR